MCVRTVKCTCAKENSICILLLGMRCALTASYYSCASEIRFSDWSRQGNSCQAGHPKPVGEQIEGAGSFFDKRRGIGF